MTDTKEKYPSAFTVENFSSTTKLAPHELQLPVGSTETINEKDGLYNPFDHRQVSHPTSTSGSLIHLLKSSLGTGILAMPMAFKNGGLAFGFVGTILVGILCTHCVQLLVAASHEICRRTRVASLGFSETAGAVFENGPKKLRPWSNAAKIFVDCALVLTYYMGGAVYVVFISTSIEQLIDKYYPELGWGTIPYMFLILVPIILSCQFRQLKYLVPFSFTANLFLIVSLGITLYYVFGTTIEIHEDTKMVGSINTIPLFFSTVIFAMEGIGVVMPVENSMKKPQHFLACPGVLYTAMFVVVLLYSVIGLFGYMKFGPETGGSVTLNLPTDEYLAVAAKILIALAVFFTYSLQFFVPMDITWRKVLENRIPPRYHNIGQVVARSVIVTLVTGFAAAVPDLEPIIGLVGSICFSILGIFIPAVVDSVLHWEADEFGIFKWKLYKNIFLIIFAIFALISGSYASIATLVNNDEE